MVFIPPRFGNMETYSDEQVVDLVLEGKIEMYELLMRRYNERLFRVTRTILKNDDEAQDVMQDAYLRAYACLNGFRKESTFATWLTRIAVNEALARVKRRERIDSIDDPHAGDRTEVAMSPSNSSPEQETARRQLRDAVEALVEALPVAYRSVFVLRYVEGLSVRETAECLQISEEATKMRAHRARALLRRSLKDRLGVVSSEIFPLRQPVCDAVVAGVFRQMAAAPQ
jgi:RNA polymerase sigma-70 factor, ECF subfamily